MRDNEIPPDGSMGDIFTAESAESAEVRHSPSALSALSAVPCSFFCVILTSFDLHAAQSTFHSVRVSV